MTPYVIITSERIWVRRALNLIGAIKPLQLQDTITRAGALAWLPASFSWCGVDLDRNCAGEVV